MSPVAITPLSTFRNDTPYPFCPGCGHQAILDQLNVALVASQVRPEEVVLVTDIGCSGLSDQYFATSAFHGLHGRSITYATGIKLARPDLKVIVLIGDGGTGIGGAHLLNAARRNIGLTVLVLNNLNFGMTGGQHSTTTPNGAITSTTPDGNRERPLDICATVAANGAGYVWRGTSFDSELPDRIAEAVRSECFALLDVWELCTAYFVPSNHWSKKTLLSTMDALGMNPGTLHRVNHPEYSAAYRQATRQMVGQPLAAPKPIKPQFTSPLDRPFRLIIAGSAGAKVRSTARLVGEAALLSGLRAAQRDDYPITVKAGHSVSELVLSPDAIEHAGITTPDAMIVLSRDGASKVSRHLASMRHGGRVFAPPGLGDLGGQAEITVIAVSHRRLRLDAESVTLYIAARAFRELGLLPLEALEAAAATRLSTHAEQDAATIRAAATAADAHEA
jgi:pyruvate/2-oxoacid:ferredoxin oxidoreductase beta subunit/Pyruvate/2-oxoacid:ferredoxin oxidoreductase gamma subunit